MPIKILFSILWFFFSFFLLFQCGEDPASPQVIERIEKEIIRSHSNIIIYTNSTANQVIEKETILFYINARELRQQGHIPQTVRVQIEGFVTNVNINPITDIASLILTTNQITKAQLTHLKTSGLVVWCTLYGENKNNSSNSQELLGQFSNDITLPDNHISNIAVPSLVSNFMPTKPIDYETLKSNYIDFSLAAQEIVVEHSILPPIVSPEAVITRSFVNCGKNTTINETISASKTINYTMGYTIQEGFSISRASSTLATVENETHQSSFSDTTLSGKFKQTFKYGILGANATTSFQIGFDHNWQHLNEETTRTQFSVENSTNEQKILKQNWSKTKTISESIVVSANVNIPPQSKVQVDGYINIRENLTVPFVQKLKLTAQAYTNVNYVLERDFSSFYESLEALAIAENKIFVADVSRDDIQVLDLTTHEYLASFGTTGSGNGQFQYPTAIAIDITNQKIFVADSTRDDIQIFNLKTYAYLGRFGGNGGEDGKFRFPHALALKGNRLFVADVQRDDIQVFDLNTYQFIGKFGTNGTSNGQFLYPHSMAILDNQIFVLDAHRDDVQIFNLANYQFVKKFGTNGNQPGKFINPRAIAVSKSRVFISDTVKNNIQIFDTQTHSYLATLDTSQISGYLEGPTAIALANGRIFITDNKSTNVSTDTIYAFKPSLNYSTRLTGKELEYFLYENKFPGTILEINENEIIMGVQGSFFIGNLIETYTEVLNLGHCTD